MQTLNKRIRLPASADEAFAWHGRDGTVTRLMPLCDKVRVVSQTGGIKPGGRVEMFVRLAPLIWKRWVAEHKDYEPGRLFRDVQTTGPFAAWDHRHAFEPLNVSSCILQDQIEYQLPLGFLGHIFGSGFATRKLARMFAYRHAVSVGDLAHHARYTHLSRIRVLVSGASGMIGRTTCAMLTTGGHEVARLVRPPRKTGPGEIAWNPDQGTIDAAAIDAFSPGAVIHLAGESIVGRWNDAKMLHVRDSRVRGTELLARTIASLTHKPAVFLSASGTSIYGDHADNALDESAATGDGFLAALARDWEAATTPASVAGIRTVHLRIGWVLTPQGGSLAEMLPYFQLGLGGRVGNGRQFIPWVSIDDCAAAITHAMLTDSISGPVNIAAPNPVSSTEFARTLGTVLHRPAMIRCPAWLARAAFGKIADESVLSSQRIRPRVLEDTNFHFRHTRLEDALKHVLGRLA